MKPHLHSAADVSRETMDNLRSLEELVKKWTSKINLVSRSSIPTLWDRHIWDSVQLTYGRPEVDHWVDIGSGGGFPGLVIAVISKEHPIAKKITLIESDRRKCAFLREARRVLDLSIEVIADRIEAVVPQKANILSARALADLDNLMHYAERHLGNNGVALFPKGAKRHDEILNARKNWSFHLVTHKSITDPAAAILEVKDIQRA